ncbi:MAG: hypothetical protein ACLGIN_14165 [Candidatus Sericytochromatia bacterium]
MGVWLFLIGIVAALAATVLRPAIVRRLGTGWLIRYMGIQAGLINAALVALVLALGRDWAQGAGLVLLPVAYGLGFFFYSLSNIDWTVKKFHTEGE